MKTAAVTLLVAALLVMVGAAVVVRFGLYDISATTAHTSIVYRLLETAMRHSVRQRAAEIQAPPLGEPDRLSLGAACYRRHCEQCHGGPGVAQGAIGKSLQPLPGPLMDAARRWRPQEVYWITRHGIKMSGMPAWELRLTDDQLWAVTAFVDGMAELSPSAYRQAMDHAQARPCGADASASAADTDPLQQRSREEQAQLALRQYACIGCHRVPGLVGPDTNVGPSLERFARREFLPGGLPNNRENLMKWLQRPQELRPGTAMPDMGLGERHAGMIADYLLRAD